MLMGKPMLTRGFTLIEVIISLMIMLVITTIALPIISQDKMVDTVISEMLKAQVSSIHSNSQVDVIINDQYLYHYNKQGNVSNALSFNYYRNNVIVRLGYGSIRYE